MSKGSNWERDLANILDEAGWGVLRCGGSGGGTSDDRPDLIAGCPEDGRLWVIEAKYKSGRNIYLEPQEIAQIRQLATAFGGEPIVAARYDSRSVDAEADWYLFKPHQLPTTGSGKYAVRVADLGGAEKRLSEEL